MQSCYPQRHVYGGTDTEQEIQKLHGFTQEELAERLGISAGHMGKIETGAKGISIDVMVVLSSLFNVSLDYLILGKEPIFHMAEG